MSVIRNKPKSRRIGIRISIPHSDSAFLRELPDGSILLTPTGSTYNLGIQLEAVGLGTVPSEHEDFDPIALDTRVVAIRPFCTPRRTLVVHEKETQ